MYVMRLNLFDSNPVINRETIHRGLGDLVMASYVAKNGNPNSFNLDEWVNITS